MLKPKILNILKRNEYYNVTRDTLNFQMADADALYFCFRSKLYILRVIIMKNKHSLIYLRVLLYP